MFDFKKEEKGIFFFNTDTEAEEQGKKHMHVVFLSLDFVVATS